MNENIHRRTIDRFLPAGFEWKTREFVISHDSKERKEKVSLPCQNSFSTLSVRVECAGVSLVGLFNRSVVLLLLTGVKKCSALSQSTEWENARAQLFHALTYYRELSESQAPAPVDENGLPSFLKEVPLNDL